MASSFDRLMRAADRVQSRVFGEKIRITPAGSPSGHRAEMKAATPDPARPERTVQGVFTRSTPDTRGRLDGARQGEKLRTLTTLATAPAQVWFSAEVLASLGYALRTDDRVTLADRPGAPAFTVADFHASDVADGAYPLVAA